MNRSEVEQILRRVLRPEPTPYKAPTDSDWEELQQKFQTEFPDEFISFINLMAFYAFPGDILNVTSEVPTNGNDTMLIVYDFERKNGSWQEDLLPFYSIGNGDYFAISIIEGKKTAVYYISHADGIIEKYSENFEKWLIDLPSFLEE